jgi:aconitase B
MLYLERPGCNLCMGNKKKAKGDTVMATSTSFQGRVVEDTEGKRRIFTFVTHCCCLSTILGRTPTIEYKAAVKNQLD